jgi:hypothetical protein
MQNRFPISELFGFREEFVAGGGRSIAARGA